jgi:ATP-binding cassette subfamily B protein
MNRTTNDMDALSWPLDRLGEALGALAHQLGLIPQPLDLPVPPQQLRQGNRETIGRWIEAVADWLDIEAEPVEILYPQVEQVVQNIGPAILRLPGDDEPRFLVLLKSKRRTVTFLDADLAARDVRTEVIGATLRRQAEEPLIAEIDRVLDRARVSRRRQAKARAAILNERLSSARIGEGWLLRLLPGDSIWSQARQAGLPRLFLSFLGVYIPKMIAYLAEWWVLWRGALQGEPDWGWLLAWLLLLFTNLPFRLLEPWFGGLFSIIVGWLFKQRLLYGAMQLEPEEIRCQGAGQLLGRTIESEAAETLALEGGLLVLSHAVDLLLAIPILVVGAGRWPHAVLLGGWMVVALALTWRYVRQRRRWTELRLDITHDLVERMVGHQTRLAQESPDRWHAGEDQAIESYLAQSRATDRMAALVKALVPRGWLLLGLLALAPAFIAGDNVSPALAVGLGGTLFVYQSLQLLSMGLLSVADAAIAWEKAAPLFHSAARSKVKGLPAFILTADDDLADAQERQPALDAHDLVYRYYERGEPILQKCNLHIYPGDRVLLEGPSGGGKSTLTSLIIGLRSPESGLLLLQGLDRQTLGAEGWRQRVAAAPQFHENHVFIGTFAFNLLMGRGWPPQETDFQEAEEICHELGLGGLLERMPAGMLQMVGEVGWQLSHGERSRLYVARALLQGADLIVLDESFAALDPENLRLALQCTLERAATLIVIAHP